MSDLPSSTTAIQILLILLPGFFVLRIEQALSFKTVESNLDKITHALFYSFFAYVLNSLFNRPLVSWTVKAIDAKTQNITINAESGVMGLFLISVALGCIVGFLKTHDYHMRFARKIKITRRTSRPSIWQDVFHDKYQQKKKDPKEEEEAKGPYVMVHLTDGRMIYGWPEYFSDDYREGPVVFVTDAQWISEDGKAKEIPYPGIMVNSSEIRFVQFYLPEEEEKKNEQKTTT
jgi:hypothetical protein